MVKSEKSTKRRTTARSLKRRAKAVADAVQGSSVKRQRKASQCKSESADSEEEVVKEEESKKLVKKSKRSSRTFSSILKKRTRKETKIEKCDFLDFEAAESDQESDNRKSGHRSVKFDELGYKRGKCSSQPVD